MQLLLQTNVRTTINNNNDNNNNSYFYIAKKHLLYANCTALSFTEPATGLLPIEVTAGIGYFAYIF